MQLYVDFEWFALTPLFITWSIHWMKSYKTPSLNGRVCAQFREMFIAPIAKKTHVRHVRQTPPTAPRTPRQRRAGGGGLASGKRAITEKSTQVPGTFPGRFIPNQKKAAERFWFGNIRRGWYLYRLLRWDQKPVIHGVFGAPIISIGSIGL